MFDGAIRESVLRVGAPGARWLSTGWDGGYADADAAYNISVPEGWTRTDLTAYAAERRAEAGFDTTGPTLLTGVDATHARGARDESVTAYATAGVSNPAALPMAADETERAAGREPETDEPRAGTVNVVVGTTRALDDAGLATLLSVAVEAKTATLLAETGFPGTTTDAVIAGTDPTGEAATFAGSSTAVGAAARACVRDAVRASLRSRYADREIPNSVGDAEYGVVTARTTEVFSV
ncbi:adenosylcobinamide amidohydrolase [Halocalculus aciditolerans]|uniref:Adenosylcobinamide amidohydrolase n=1 Tax=Halocalculus aciditolerans TaxID=1383812 RepID=A0A830FKP8_9EURY|nr:adenosylcobinamide amidohydrolase [Halocalculus aciditolerans]GGL65708.1 adenosylcobinamide amidohydrolase [Halocalculus aciditolerans]